MNSISDLEVEIYADGADIKDMLEMAKRPYIAGLTTNPTLMRKAGVLDYEQYARQVLEEVKEKPISFEVFSDDLNEMISQGVKISGWGDNVFVKVPITNTKGISCHKAVKALTKEGVKVNVTAIMTYEQVETIQDALDPSLPSNISVFAGRIADTGRNPIPIIEKSLKSLSSHSECKLIWASPRELLNVIQAHEVGCHIITATTEILKKLELIGKDLEQYSLETVEMFYLDAKASGFQI